jgi:Flp pilus assembly protein TadG
MPRRVRFLRGFSGAPFRLGNESASDSGAVAVEFAIVLPVFLILLFFVLDIGRYLIVQLALNNAAQLGARYVAISTDASTVVSQVDYAVGDSIVRLALLDSTASSLSVSPGEFVCYLNSENDVAVDAYGLSAPAPDTASCKDVADPNTNIKSCAAAGPNYRAMERVDLNFKWITPLNLVLPYVSPESLAGGSSPYLNRTDSGTTLIEGKAKLLCQS